MYTKVKWALTGVLLLATGGAALGDDLQTIQIQVNALRVLHDLKATPDQLKSLQQLASDTPASAKNLDDLDPNATTAPAYAGALKNLRDALLGDSDEKIEKAQDAVDELEEKHDIDSDTGAEATEPARGKANEALKLFSAGQISNYIAMNSDDLQEPTQTLLSALKECRGESPDDFASLREETAKEVAALVAGPAPRRARVVNKSVTDLLNKAKDLSDGDFTSQRADLEKEARDITTADPVDVLRHWLHYQMVDLLSNPQLGEVLTEKLNHIGKGH